MKMLEHARRIVKKVVIIKHQARHFRVSKLGKIFRAGRKPKDIAIVLSIITGLFTFFGYWFLDLSKGLMLLLLAVTILLLVYGLARGEGRK